MAARTQRQTLRQMVASRAIAALALALAAGAAAQQHVCDPHAPGGCTVCEECCHIAHNQSRCEACVASPTGCAFDCDDDAEACSRQCLHHCSSHASVLMLQCLHRCAPHARVPILTAGRAA